MEMRKLTVEINMNQWTVVCHNNKYIGQWGRGVCGQKGRGRGRGTVEDSRLLHAQFTQMKSQFECRKIQMKNYSKIENAFCRYI